MLVEITFRTSVKNDNECEELKEKIMELATYWGAIKCEHLDC